MFRKYDGLVKSRLGRHCEQLTPALRFGVIHGKNFFSGSHCEDPALRGGRGNLIFPGIASLRSQ